MPTTNEILLTFTGRDNVSPVAQSIANSVNGSANQMAGNYDSALSSIATNANGTFNSIVSGASQVNMAMMRLNSSATQILGSLGSTKSASELVFGTTSKADTNKVLINNMVETQEEAESLYNTVDKITDSSLVSMQDLIPAMNAFRSATQASYKSLNDDVAGSMANFGAFVLAQTGSTQLSLTAMMDLSKGIKGQFAALDQYGVSLASLEKTGLWKTDPTYTGKKWKGDETDIKGYLDAVNDVIGDTSALMETNEGLNAQIGKMWSRAGKRIGNEYLPQIKDMKSAFIDLDNEMGGNLSTNVLLVATAIEELSGASYKLDMLLTGFNNIRDLATKLAMRWGILTAEVEQNTQQNLQNADSTAVNTQELLENTNARYANADSALAQAQAYGEANAMMTGGVPISPTGSTSQGQSSQSTGQVLGETGAYIGADMATQAALDKALGRNKESDKLVNATKGKKGNDFWDAIGEETANSRKQAADIQKATNELGQKQNLLNKYTQGLDGIKDDYKRLTKVRNGLDENMDLLGHHGTSWLNANNVKMAGLGDALDIIDEADSEASIIKANERTRGKSFGDYGKNPLEKFEHNAYKTDLPRSGGIEAIRNYVDSQKGEGKNVENIVLGQADNLDEIGEAWYQAETGGYTKLKDKVLSAKNKVTGIDWGEGIRSLGTRMGGGLQNGLRRLSNIPSLIYSGIGNTPSRIKGAFSRFSSSLKGIKNVGIEGNLNRAFDAFSNFSLTGVTAKLKGFVANLPIIGGLLGMGATEMGVVDAELGVIEAETTAASATGAGVASTSVVAGAEMEGASAGLSFMGLAEMGLAGAFTTLIVPTLAIAAVIAILIPVIAGLAIEAMYFINLVGQVMSALDWDSIDVEGATESLQNLAIALAWLGVAMASLGFASFMSNITMAQVALQNILFGGMDATLQLLREVSIKINAMGDVSVDDSTVQGIQALGSALNAISSAMLSLTGVTLTSFIGNILTLNGKLGNLSSNLDKAKGDLQHAITVINSMDFTQIDEAKVGTIKTTLEAIGAFADAFKGLNDIRSADDWGNFTTWLLNLGGQGQSIQDAFNKAHDDIVAATQALQGYNDIGEVPEEIGTKLQNVSTAITSIADIIKALKDLKEDKGFLGALDSFANGSNDDLVTGLTNSMGTIRTIAQRINSLKTISNIDPLVAEKLKQLSTAISSISSVLDSFNNIKASSDNGVIDSMPKIIQSAHHNIRLVAANLNGLKTISNIDPTVTQKVKSVASNLKTVNSAMNEMSTLNASVGALNINGLNQKIVGVAYTISSTAFQLNKLGTNLADSNHNVDGSLTGKINNVTKGTKAMSKFATTMTAFPYVDGHNIGNKVARAVTGFKRASGQLKKINENDKVGNINSIINQVTKSSKSLKTAIKSMNFASTGKNIGSSLSRGVTGGLTNLTPRVTGAVGHATNAGASRAWTGGAYMGQSATGGFKSALKLVDAINTEINNVISTINARAPEISGAMSNATNTDGSGATTTDTGSTGSTDSTGSTGGSGDWFAGLPFGPGGSVQATSDYGQAVNPVRNNGLSPTEMASLNNMNRTGNLNNNNNPVNIIVGEGAVQLDARDLTVKESRQVMINALQGLGMIKNIELNPTQ